MATDTAIAPPPGFELDAPSTVPPLPEGFEVDQLAQAKAAPSAVPAKQGLSLSQLSKLSGRAAALPDIRSRMQRQVQSLPFHKPGAPPGMAVSEIPDLGRKMAGSAGDILSLDAIRPHLTTQEMKGQPKWLQAAERVSEAGGAIAAPVLTGGAILGPILGEAGAAGKAISRLGIPIAGAVNLRNLGKATGTVAGKPKAQREPGEMASAILGDAGSAIIDTLAVLSAPTGSASEKIQAAKARMEQVLKPKVEPNVDTMKQANAAPAPAETAAKPPVKDIPPDVAKAVVQAAPILPKAAQAAAEAITKPKPSTQGVASATVPIRSSETLPVGQTPETSGEMGARVPGPEEPAQASPPKAQTGQVGQQTEIPLNPAPTAPAALPKAKQEFQNLDEIDASKLTPAQKVKARDKFLKSKGVKPAEESTTGSTMSAGALPEDAPAISPEHVNADAPNAYVRVSASDLNDVDALGKTLTDGGGASRATVIKKKGIAQNAPGAERAKSTNASQSRRVTLLQNDQGKVVAATTYRDPGTGSVMVAHPDLPAGRQRVSKPLPQVMADGWKPVGSVLLKTPRKGLRVPFNTLAEAQQAFGFPEKLEKSQNVPQVGMEGGSPVPVVQPSLEASSGMTPEAAGIVHDHFSTAESLDEAIATIKSAPKKQAIRTALTAAMDAIREKEPELTQEKAMEKAVSQIYEDSKKTKRADYVEQAEQGASKATPGGDEHREPGVGGEVEERPAEPPKPVASPKAIRETGPGLVGMGGATPSQFTERKTAIEEAWDHVTKPFRKLVATGRIIAQTRDVKALMAKMKDVGDNTARVFSRQQSNDIRGSLDRGFGKESDEAGSALSFYVEAGGAEGIPLDEVQDNLTKAIDKMRDSTKGSGKWRAKGVEAATYALYHMEQLAPIAEQYRLKTDAQVARDNARGVGVLALARYVPHVQDLENPELGLFDKRGGGGAEPSGFRKNRKYPTFADSIAAGIDPQSLNATDLLENRISNGERLANGRAWVDTFRHVVDPETLQPVFEHIKYDKRVDGTTYPVAPSGYSLEQLGPNHVAVQNGYEGTAAALTDPSWWTRHTGGAVLMQANALGKSGRLAIDTYHVGRVAMWQMALKAASLAPELPRPSYRRGQILLDYTPKEIEAMGKDGTIPQKWVEPLIAAKPLHDLMLKSGFNIGRVSDNLHQEWIRATPVLGRFNRWVFDQFQRGVMSELWQMEFKRLKTARPEMSDDAAASQISKDLNARMGNMGRQGWLKSRTAQDTARLLALAPQWNEGLIKSELGAYRQAGKFITDTAKGKRLYAGTLLRAVGGMAAMTFLLNQAINFITRGQPTWKNKEKGIGAKLSAWIPDPWGGPGFFLNPLSLPAEVTASLIRRKERESSWLDVLNGFIGSKTSYLATPAKAELMRRDSLGRPIQAKDVPAEMAKSLLPTPIGVSSFYRALVKDGKEQYPGEFGSQIAGRFGLRLQTAATPAQDIKTMAREFNTKLGKPEPVEYAPSEYAPLRNALKTGNLKEAKTAYEKLKQSRTDAQIEKTMKSASRRAFTGNNTTEAAFLSSLDKNGKAAYSAALKERAQAYQRWLEFAKTQHVKTQH